MDLPIWLSILLTVLTIPILVAGLPVAIRLVEDELSLVRAWFVLSGFMIYLFGVSMLFPLWWGGLW